METSDGRFHPFKPGQTVINVMRFKLCPGSHQVHELVNFLCGVRTIFECRESCRREIHTKIGDWCFCRDCQNRQPRRCNTEVVKSWTTLPPVRLRYPAERRPPCQVCTFEDLRQCSSLCRVSPFAANRIQDRNRYTHPEHFPEEGDQLMLGQRLRKCSILMLQTR